MIIFDTTLLILFGLLNPVWSNKMLIRAKSRFLAKKTGGPEWSASSADAADLLDYNLKFTYFVMKCSCVSSKEKRYVGGTDKLFRTTPSKTLIVNPMEDLFTTFFTVLQLFKRPAQYF